MDTPLESPSSATDPDVVFTRRRLLQIAGTAGLLAGARAAYAQHEGHDMSAMPGMTLRWC